MGNMELAGAGFFLDAVEADRIAGTVPTGMKIAAHVAGNVASIFHVEGHKRFALFGFDVVENQRLVQAVFAVGDQPVPIGPEGAMPIEIEQSLAQNPAILQAVGKKDMPSALALIPEGRDDFLVVSPIEMGEAAAVGDDLA